MAAWETANNNIYSILFLLTGGSANITVRAHKSTEQGCLGDGVAAWKSLMERFDGNTKEAWRACREKLFSSAMRAGSDPTDFIAKMDDLRLHLEDMGEEILEDTYADLLLNSFPKEFEFIKQMHHRDRSFTLDQIKQTANSFCIDELSRDSSGPSVAGRGAAMAAASKPRSVPSVQSLWALPVQLPWFREGTRSQTEQTEGQRQRWRSFAHVVLLPQN